MLLNIVVFTLSPELVALSVVFLVMMPFVAGNAVCCRSVQMEFPRAWLLPVLKRHIRNTELEFFAATVLPLGARLRNRGIMTAVDVVSCLCDTVACMQMRSFVSWLSASSYTQRCVRVIVCLLCISSCYTCRK